MGTSTGMFNEFSQKEFDEFKRNGIEYLELGSGVFRNKTDEEIEAWVRNFKQKADNAGIEIWSAHLPFRGLDISATDDGDRNNTIQELKDYLALLEPLNIKKFVVHPSYGVINDEDRPFRIENSIASLKILTKEVKKYAAALAMENLPRTALGNTSDEVLEIVNAVGKGIEVCFDSNHMLQETPEEFVAKVGDLITTLHISDYDAIDEKHWLPGTEGVINWNYVIAELVNIRFEGPWLYEVSRGGGRGRDENHSAKDLSNNWEELKTDYLNYKNSKDE